MARNPNRQEPETGSKSPTSEKIAAWLKKWGFPSRHISKLPDMVGPGLERAIELKPAILSGDSLLILCGDRGPGKTQIATKWAEIVAQERSKASRYHKAHDFLCMIRQQFDDDKQLKGAAREVLEKAKRTTLLVLDEWSELAGTEWEKRTMTSLIDHRYDNMLATVIITNHGPEAAAEAVGRSIWSRAQETGGVVVCNWESYRKS